MRQVPSLGGLLFVGDDGRERYYFGQTYDPGGSGHAAEAVGDDGYRRIRSDVVFGRLRPGHKLRLEGLKDTYGVSVSTLREIHRLTAEGLVVAEGKRGFEVAPVSAGNLKELAELRLLLELHAMQVSFENADVEWEGRVVSAHHKLAATERLMEFGDR